MADQVNLSKTGDKNVEDLLLEQYDLKVKGMDVNISIIKTKKDFVPVYKITFMGVGEATKLLLISLRPTLLNMVPIDPTKINDKRYLGDMNQKYIESSGILISKYLPETKPEIKNILISYLLITMLGLGDMEAPLADDKLEEIAVNGPDNWIFVFHIKYGWCRTNLKPLNDEVIYNQSAQIGRGVGREINNLTPLMDAELQDGSRVNATLFPISQCGNTITIRKSSKNPWTMSAMIKNGTINSEIAALVWLCISNEISILFSGGTASGKTSFLNASSIFFPPDRRVITVEETRELTLPKFLHWIPMVTRQPNPEGKGEVTLYDLMINALRQRPDIMMIGEVRTQKDAETLFEAIHTGHSVYGTVHADNVQDTILRMTSPPINTPKITLNSFGAIVTLFRHRTRGIRRVLEFGEVMRTGDASVIYRWDVRKDNFQQINRMSRLAETFSLYAGLNETEMLDELAEKKKVIDYMVSMNVFNVDDAGLIIANYYKNKETVMNIVNTNTKFSRDLFE